MLLTLPWLQVFILCQVQVNYSLGWPELDWSLNICLIWKKQRFINKEILKSHEIRMKSLIHKWNTWDEITFVNCKSIQQVHLLGVFSCILELDWPRDAPIYDQYGMCHCLSYLPAPLMPPPWLWIICTNRGGGVALLWCVLNNMRGKQVRQRGIF